MLIVGKEARPKTGTSVPKHGLIFSNDLLYNEADRMSPSQKISMAILMLSVGLVLSSFLLINKPTNSVTVDKVQDNPNGNNSREDNTWKTGGTPILDALPVFYSNSTVKSMEEALAIFKQNLVTTEESTAEKLSQYGKPNDANIVDEIILFAQHATAERREWRNDQYWLLPIRTAYVLCVSAVSKHES